jgi:hypothetical protein
MEASIMPRLPLVLTVFKPEASTTAADALVVFNLRGHMATEP